MSEYDLCDDPDETGWCQSPWHVGRPYWICKSRMQAPLMVEHARSLKDGENPVGCFLSDVFESSATCVGKKYRDCKDARVVMADRMMCIQGMDPNKIPFIFCPTCSTQLKEYGVLVRLVRFGELGRHSASSQAS